MDTEFNARVIEEYYEKFFNLLKQMKAIASRKSSETSKTKRYSKTATTRSDIEMFKCASTTNNQRVAGTEIPMINNIPFVDIYKGYLALLEDFEKNSNAVSQQVFVADNSQDNSIPHPVTNSNGCSHSTSFRKGLEHVLNGSHAAVERESNASLRKDNSIPHPLTDSSGCSNSTPSGRRLEHVHNGSHTPLERESNASLKKGSAKRKAMNPKKLQFKENVGPNQVYEFQDVKIQGSTPATQRVGVVLKLKNHVYESSLL